MIMITHLYGDSVQKFGDRVGVEFIWGRKNLWFGCENNLWHKKLERGKVEDIPVYKKR